MGNTGDYGMQAVAVMSHFLLVLSLGRRWDKESKGGGKSKSKKGHEKKKEL